MNNKPKNYQVKAKIIWVFSSILAILISGTFVTFWTINRADNLMREDFLQRTRLVAQAINGDRVKKLSGTDADLTSFEYLQLKEQLIAARMAYPECRFLYLMGQRDNGKVFFYVDSEPAGSKDESPPGQIYEEISSNYLSVFNTKTECTVGPVTDRWGTWVSSLIPIKNNVTGDIIAVLGMDMDGKAWKRNAVREGFAPVLVTLILIATILGGSVMMAWRGRLATRNIRVLHYIEAGMAAVIGVTITLFSVWTVNKYETDNYKKLFYHILNTKTIGVTSVLQTLQDVELEGLSRLFSWRQHITEDSFRDFTKYLEKNSAIRGLEWIQVVSEENKTAFEQYGRKELSPDYQIWELDPSGNRIQAKGRLFYYPIYFESLVGSASSVGFDLGSEPIIAKTLEDARRSGHILCTDPIRKEDEPGQEDEILVFRPVFKYDQPELLLGFTTAIVKMGTLLKTAAASGFDNTPTSMDLYMLPKSGPAIPLSSVNNGADTSKKYESFSITRPIFMFGRTFIVIARPGPEFAALNQSRYGWVTGIAGLLTTITVVLVIGFILRRREKLELLVHERTSALQESEGLQRLLLERISAGVMIIDTETQTIEAVNPFAARLIGAQEEQILGHRYHTVICPKPEGNCPVIDMGQEVNNLDTIIIRSDGSHSPILKSIKRIRIHDKDKLLETFVDISDIKRTGESLRESRQILQTILDTSPIRIFWKDCNSVFRGCNRQFAMDSGFNDPGEVIGKSDYDMGWREQAEACRAEDRQVIETGTQKLLIEEPQTTPDGKTTWLITSKTPLRDASGNVSGVLGVYMDITEYREAMEALRNSEEKFRAMVETSSDWIWETDMNSIYTYTSPNIEKILGYKPEEIIGKSPFNLMIHEEIEKIPDILKETVNSVKPIIGLQHKNRHKDGSQIILETNGIPIFDKNGNLSGYRGIDRDITRRKNAEEALIKSYAILKGVLESPKDVVIFALDRQYRYIAFNKNHHQTMKKIWDADITLGTSMLEYIKSTEDNIKAKQNFDRVLSGESFMIAEEYGDTAHERRYYEDIYNPIIDENGEIIGLTVFLTDITERIETEEQREKLQGQLHQAQKMESVGRLAGGVAHDFNNMLSVIIGYSELAMQKKCKEVSLQSELEAIHKAAKRSADLTRQLLAFARKQTVIPRIIDLNDVIESILKMLRRLIGENIELFWIPGTKKFQISIDPSQIDQILTNLCVNAKDAISGVGKVIIQTEAASFDEYYCSRHPEVIQGDYILLSISDNGCGMNKDTLDNIFEPFFTTKENGKGTGLGLATVYGIVKQNNGFIYVYSEPGQGTTFKIYLPACKTKPVDFQKESQLASATSINKTILLVEDETNILELGKLMLERLGFKVLSASTPGEAIHMAKEHIGDIHLLITDVIMPEMNGRDLAKRLISFYPGIKRLFMSGYTGDIIAHHGLLDENVHFMQKPFSFEDLASKVREALDSK
jgi:two-component system, cell cycle sensor histidine kinase and response regulator CckA